jgi:holin-like protein
VQGIVCRSLHPLGFRQTPTILSATKEPPGMIASLTTILMFQLIGETLARSLDLPVPGPVIGMALFLAFLAAIPKAAKAIEPTALGILSHLSLLFVPAGVGIVGHLDKLGSDGLGIVMSLGVSTAIAIAVAALVFERVNRMTGKTK